MIFVKTKLKDVFVIEPETLEDSRGFFARVWDRTQFSNNKLSSRLVQCSISFSKKKGTIRGIHYQLPPYEETKIIRCTRGKIYDVVVDLRPRSKTFKEWFSAVLDYKNHKMIYVPKGCAHGFQTLENNTEVFYQMSQVHNLVSERGLRWNDPTFNIKWPLRNTIISEKDRKWENYELQ